MEGTGLHGLQQPLLAAQEADQDDQESNTQTFRAAPINLAIN